MQIELKYPLALRVLHWLMAVLILSLVGFGYYMTGLAKDDPLRGTLYGLHKSLGVTVLMLALIRIGVRLGSKVPPLPTFFPWWERLAAETNYFVFYVLMLAIPLSGYLMSNAFGLNVSWFGVGLPKFFSAPDRELGAFLNDVHEILAYAILALAALHISAVVKHYVRDGLNLLKRMI